MQINTLRGSVADRPIDAQVVHSDSYPPAMIEKIMAAHPQVRQVDASSLSDYDKG